MKGEKHHQTNNAVYSIDSISTVNFYNELNDLGEGMQGSNLISGCIKVCVGTENRVVVVQFTLLIMFVSFY